MFINLRSLFYYLFHYHIHSKQYFTAFSQILYLYLMYLHISNEVWFAKKKSRRRRKNVKCHYEFKSKQIYVASSFDCISMNFSHGEIPKYNFPSHSLIVVLDIGIPFPRCIGGTFLLNPHRSPVLFLSERKSGPLCH